MTGVAKQRLTPKREGPKKKQKITKRKETLKTPGDTRKKRSSAVVRIRFRGKVNLNSSIKKGTLSEGQKRQKSYEPREPHKIRSTMPMEEVRVSKHYRFGRHGPRRNLRLGRK